jgi:ADP-ribose pyrophosphatase YjhB (NUDIX family)
MSGLFVYGTMLHRPLLERLVGDLDGAEAVDAVLPGYRVVRDEKDHMPVLATDAEGSARGTLWTGLPEEARALLDVYELTRSYRPVPVVVWAEGEAREAWAYAPPPWMPPSGEDWDLEAWLRVDGEMDFLRAEEIAGRPPSGAEMLTQAPMIAHRAAAAVRAREGAPTVLRRRAGPGDTTWRKLEPPAGRFFRFERLEVAHLRFDGARNEGLGREVMVGVDAALVLPYDRARDRVLLVEQVRTGPLRRGDGQPWILEPVAGLVDAHETPEEGARREAREEAALDLQTSCPCSAATRARATRRTTSTRSSACATCPTGGPPSGGSRRSTRTSGSTSCRPPRRSRWWTRARPTPCPSSPCSCGSTAGGGARAAGLTVGPPRGGRPLASPGARA